MEYTFFGEGDGDVERIVHDLLATGYQGGLSIEPHLAVVYHEGWGESADNVRHKNYVEYARRFMRLVETVTGNTARAG